jgi:flagellar biosynthetic protein FlhB
MADNDTDRTEQPTPYKLKKAREKGQIAKSADLVSVLVFIVAIAYLYWKGAYIVEEQFKFDRALLSKAGQFEINEVSFWWLATRMVAHALALLGPLFGAIAVAAVIGNLVQTGPVFTLAPVKADWSRLNPIEGFKKMLGARKLFEGLRAITKLSLLVLVAYHALRANIDDFHTVSQLGPRGLLYTITADIASVGFKMALVLGLIAIIDAAYTHREFMRKMRMSKREVKDEIKNRDGDPRIRSRLRQLRQEMLKRASSTRNTRHADVLIVNPVHYAVALKYVHGEMESPRLLAKGSGAFAQAMRTVAAKHSIPIVQNVTLARKLFREMEIDQHVPPSLYADVARIIVWVFAMRKARAGQRPGAARAKGDLA